MRIQNKSPFKTKKTGDYRIEARANQDEATVYLYDEISWFGIPVDEFVKDLNKISASTIHLRVNSPGGSVFDGTTIYNAIRQHKSKVIAHVDGLAASIASVIVMAADEVHMADNAFLMIHEPWSMVIGNAEGLRAEADLLDKVRDTIAKTYMNKSGMERDRINELMNAETWYTAQEAKDAGFADFIYEETLEKAQVTLFDLSVFSKVPEQLQQECGPPTARDLERILRDSGCTQKQAKSILAAGYDSLQRDAASESGQEGVTEHAQRDVADGTDQPKADAQRDVEQAKQPDRVDPTTLLLVNGERLLQTQHKGESAQ